MYIHVYTYIYEGQRQDRSYRFGRIRLVHIKLNKSRIRLIHRCIRMNIFYGTDTCVYKCTYMHMLL
jgi:hypothetical protein